MKHFFILSDHKSTVDCRDVRVDVFFKSRCDSSFESPARNKPKDGELDMLESRREGENPIQPQEFRLTRTPLCNEPSFYYELCSYAFIHPHDIII